MVQITNRSHFNVNNMKDYSHVDSRLDGGELWRVVFEGPLRIRVTVSAPDSDSAVLAARRMVPCLPVAKVYPA